MDEIEFKLKPEFCPHNWIKRTERDMRTKELRACYECTLCPRFVYDDDEDTVQRIENGELFV